MTSKPATVFMTITVTAACFTLHPLAFAISEPEGSSMGGGFWSSIWTTHTTNPAIFSPLLAFVGSLLTFAGIAAGAWIAFLRHLEQTRADRQRRITESFAKAVEQLGNEKIQVRHGGIYTLERIARESELDYWPIMETLTAFVRVQAHWKDENTALPQVAIGHDQPKTPLRPPPADIEAVLAVIRRRDAKSRKREQVNEWILDLTLTDLRMAFLHKAHLEGADLRKTHLEGANLREVHLEGAHLNRAYLEGANLLNAHLEGAILAGAHLEGTDLDGVYLDEANLTVTHLEGADLSKAKGLKQDQIDKAFGNAETKLPEGLTRPAHWLSNASTK
jgi:hypothetical protein